MANPTHITANGVVAELVENVSYENVQVDGDLAGGVLTIGAIIDRGESEIENPCGRITEVGLFDAPEISDRFAITDFKLRVEGAKEDDLDIYVTFS